MNQIVKVEQLSDIGKEDRVTYLHLVLGGIIVTFIFSLWWFSSSHIPQNFTGWLHLFDISLFALLSYVVWHQIVMEIFSWYIALSMKIPKFLPAAKGLRVALLTAFVPGKESYEVLEKTLKAMVEVEYAHDTWLLDEGDDYFARVLCARFGVKHFSRKGLLKFNQPEGKFKAKTKAGNYNAWFDSFSAYYDIVAQHDVDFVPHKSFLLKTLGYFRDSEIAFVGTPQIYGNQDESWIARGAAEQAFSFYGLMQKGLFGQNMQLFIGANHIMRVKAYQDINGYSGHIVEDHLTGMRLYANKWKSVYLPEILAVGEGPATWDAYFSQQMRWAYGLIDILLRHSPKILPKMHIKHAFNYFMLQQHYFHGLAQGIGVILLLIYFITGLQITSMGTIELILLYAPVLIIQLLSFHFLQRFYVDPRCESGWLLKSKLLNLAVWPIYLMAFLSVLLQKRLTYKVTPKGEAQKSATSLKLFIPHLILGSLTAGGLILSFFTRNQAPQFLFFASLNSLIMYLFVGLVLKEKLQVLLQRVISMQLPAFNLNFLPKIKAAKNINRGTLYFK